MRHSPGLPHHPRGAPVRREGTAAPSSRINSVRTDGSCPAEYGVSDLVIHHLSIAAGNPQNVATVLAEIIGGAAVAFPPNPGSYWALQLDSNGTGIEIYPAGTTLHPDGAQGVAFVRAPDSEPGYGAFHFAISVATEKATVAAIAAREGWSCFECMRGGFHVLEIWLENRTMIEVLPPGFAAEYLAVTKPEGVVEHMSQVKRVKSPG